MDDDFNLLVDELPCPLCGRTAQAVVRFRVGPCKYYEYKLGQKVDWSRKGRAPFPAQQGKAKLKQTVSLKACEACVSGRAAAEKGVLALLSELDRLVTVKKDERLVDGVYPEKAFVASELERLGFPAMLAADATLLVREGVLESVTPGGRAKVKPAEEPLRLRALEFAPAGEGLSLARAAVEKLLDLERRDAAQSRALAAGLNAVLVHGGRAERAWLAEASGRPSADELLGPLLELARQALDHRLEGRSARVGFVIERVADRSWIYRPMLFEAVEIKRRTVAP